MPDAEITLEGVVYRVGDVVVVNIQPDYPIIAYRRPYDYDDLTQTFTATILSFNYNYMRFYYQSAIGHRFTEEGWYYTRIKRHAHLGRDAISQKLIRMYEAQ